MRIGRLIVMRKYGDGTDFLIFRTKPFQFRWFTDCGYWFLYIHFGKRYFRFSDAGFLTGRNK